MTQLSFPVRWLQVNFDWLLILSCLLLLPFEPLFNLPLGIMALLGLQQAFQNPVELWRDQAVRLMLALFLCIWLPMAVSVVDAVNISRATSTTLLFLRFPLAGIFIIQTLRNETARQRLFVGSVIVVGLWCCDAMVQWLTGNNLLGYPYDGIRLSGIFYPKLRLGFVVATLSPLYFKGIRQLAVRQYLAWLLLFPLLLTVLLSGNRVAWVMLVVSCVAFSIYRYRQSTSPARHKTAVAIVALALVSITLVPQLPGMQDRLTKTMDLFSGNYASIDAATSHRLSLWVTAANMAKTHWFNGVGPRGFRYVYEDFAQDGDYFLAHGIDGSTHPHQMLLEIAAETGVIGIMGLVLFALLLWRRFRRSHEPCAIPWGLAVLIAMFPLNAHMAFYSSYWSTISWWLILITVAMLSKDEQRTAVNPGR